MNGAVGAVQIVNCGFVKYKVMGATRGGRSWEHPPLVWGSCALEAEAGLKIDNS